MITTSSALATTLVPASSRSDSSFLTTITHKRGESTLPSEIPLLTFLIEWADPTVEYTTLLVSMVCMSPTMGHSVPSSVIAPVIAVGVTLLKAPSMSRNAARK